MSMFSYGKLEVYKRSGRPLPVDGGLNKDQQPTKNAAEILETHESYPIGYWKGSGLSLALWLVLASAPQPMVFCLANAMARFVQA